MTNQTLRRNNSQLFFYKDSTLIFFTRTYEWLIGLRYTRAKRRLKRNGFISFIASISMLGITLGVAALIIVLSVMNGFQKEVRDRMLSVLPHIEVMQVEGTLNNWKALAQQLSKEPEVKGVAPYVVSQAMLSVGSNVRGVMLRGILPEQEPQVSDIAKQVFSGHWQDIQPGSYKIVLGLELARNLQVGVGDQLMLIVPDGQVSIAGFVPRVKTFTVAAIFTAGHYEYDSTLAYIHLQDAMTLLRSSSPTGLRLRINHLQEAPEVALALQKKLPPNVWVSDWSQQNRSWFAAVKTEKRMMFIILTLIVAVAAFNLVSTLVMSVTDKQADIAILRTMGATPFSIMKIFVIQGMLIGLIGTLLGVFFGTLIAYNVGHIVAFLEALLGIEFLPKSIYFISQMPSDIHFSDVITIALMSFLFSLLATLYPSWRASMVNPAQALRYE